MGPPTIKDEQVFLNSVKIEGQQEQEAQIPLPQDPEYTIIVQNVNEFGEVTQQVVDPSNIPQLLGDLSVSTDGSVQIVQLEDGQYTTVQYLVQGEQGLENETTQYEIAHPEPYQIIEEYADQTQQNIEPDVQYETLYVEEQQEEEHMEGAEVYTISAEEIEAVRDSEQPEPTEEECVQETVEEGDQQMVIVEEEDYFEEESTLENKPDRENQQNPVVLFSVAEETVPSEEVIVKQEETYGEDEDKLQSDSDEAEQSLHEEATTAEASSSQTFSIIYECSVCQKMYKTSMAVESHIRKAHTGPNAQEIETKKNQPDALELNLCPCCKEPSESAHTRGDFACDQCNHLFGLENSLRRHKSIEHPVGNTFQCSDCSKEFQDREELIQHTRVHSLNSVKCNCGREFARRYHLERHIYQTGCAGIPKQVYECRVCGKSFTRKDYLADHLREHAGIPLKKRQKKYLCQFCKKEFATSSLLNVHVRTHTGERPYPCDLCEKRFPSGGALKKHRRKHTGEKPYMCSECGVSFAAKETLNRHTRTHTGEKPHKCKFCGKAFIQAAQLRAHIYHHTGENAYPCSYCERSFNRKLRLTTHMKYMHEGAEPLKCPYEGCDKTFFRNEDVNRHVVIHSNERPFTCEICQKSFTVKSSLKIHSNIHRKEQPVSCEVCCRAFIRKDCLVRHMRTRHRDLVEEIVKNSERKQLKSQVLKCLVEQPEELESIKASVVWTELSLTDSIKDLLTLLVDEDCLTEFGHPDAPADKVLESVIRRCGHEPADRSKYDYIGRMRANTRLLFTVVIDDVGVKELLKRQSVDDVIMHVLSLAKKQAKEQNVENPSDKEEMVSKRENESEPEPENDGILSDPDEPMTFSEHELEDHQENGIMTEEQEETNSGTEMKVAVSEENSIDYAIMEESL